MIEIRWHGRGGQGAFTAAKILGEAAMLEEKRALSFPSFGPERRGAPIQAYTKIDEKVQPDRSVVTKADYIIYLDETLYTENAKNDLKENGRIFINAQDVSRFAGERNIVAYDMNTVCENVLGRPVSNTGMLALLASNTGIVDLASAQMAIADFLTDKVARKNQQLIDVIEREVTSGDSTKIKGL